MRLSNRIKQWLLTHLDEEAALLVRVREVATHMTAGGLRQANPGVTPELQELAGRINDMQLRRAQLRVELSRTTQIPAEHIRLSQLDLGTPAETADFRSKCAALRLQSVQTISRVRLTSQALGQWQNILIDLLTEATGGTRSVERYGATGQRVAAAPAIRVEMRS